MPGIWGNSLFPFNWMSGGRRGQLRYLKERLMVMHEYKDDIQFLKKYPINPIGNPLKVEFDGYQFNKRWSNKLMRARVVLQGLAVFLILITAYLFAN